MDDLQAHIYQLRKQYSMESLDESNVLPDAIAQLDHWMSEAIKAEVPEPNAVMLSTVSADGSPSSRIVLIRNTGKQGLSFFTNYRSRKGKEMDNNAKVALTFFWPQLERQIRVEGTVSKLSEAESDAYFQSRPRASQLGAWASEQSTPITGRKELEEKMEKLEAQYRDKTVPRPPHWGGFLVKPLLVEFWQGRPSRLHDRIQYTLTTTGEWRIERLSP